MSNEKKYWSITVLVSHENAIKKHILQNQTSEEIIKFRSNIFSIGIMLPVSPGVWIIAPPWEVKEVTITLQKELFT